MGADITIYVERYNHEEGYWELIKGPNPSIQRMRTAATYYREMGNETYAKTLEEEAAAIAEGTYLNPHELDSDSSDAPMVYQNWVCNDRNYFLFSILANVRNHFSTPIPFISEARGLPDDCCFDLEYAFDEEYYHDVSYVTLQELLHYDWAQTITTRTHVGPEGYDEILQNGKLDGHYYPASGTRVSNEEMERLLSEGSAEEHYTMVSYEQTYADLVGDFYSKSIPALTEASLVSDFSDVRIVFAFFS